MIRQLTVATSALAAAAALLLAGAAPSPAAADGFGQHVRTCAQTMGFDAEHNPGRHHGHSGWTPDHSC